jgi:hypothetical protein
MTFTFANDIVDDVRAALTRAGEGVGVGSEEHRVTVFHGDGDIDAATVRRALDSGETVAVLRPRAGQLDAVEPNAGLAVPNDVALYAVKRVPASGRPGQHHTIVTTVHNGRTVDGQIKHDGTDTAPAAAPSAPLPLADIVTHMRRHMALTAEGVDGMAPPAGSSFAVLPTTNNTWSYDAKIIDDISNEQVRITGRAQKIEFNLRQTHYVYLADGGPSEPYYVIFQLNTGYVNPAVQGLISDDTAVRCALRHSFFVGTSPTKGALSLVAFSPNPTSSTPVDMSVSYPMTVMATVQGAGKRRTEFSPSLSRSEPNPDAGVNVSQYQGVAWTYGNTTDWNAFSNRPFSDWWASLYGDGNKIKPINNSCKISNSFATVSVWTVPGGQPGPIQFSSTIGVFLTGFTERGHDATGHNRMLWWQSTPDPVIATLELDKIVKVA